jgi:hypothetical protein
MVYIIYFDNCAFVEFGHIFYEWIDERRRWN